MHNSFVRLVAESLKDERFTHVDVGCSGGLEPVFRQFAGRFRAIGFDISVDACRRLADEETQADVHYVAGAVDIPPSHPFARRAEGKPVHVSPLDDRLSAHWAQKRAAEALRASSLDAKLNANAWQLTELAHATPVYLLETFERLGFMDIDFLKIDIDGPDFRVLNSLDGELGRLGVLGVRMEVSLFGGTDDTTNTFHNTDRFMRGQGFELVRLDNRTYSTRALPARFCYPMPAQTESGRLFQAEAFYARDPAGSPALAAALSAEKLSKLAAIFAAWGQPDGAAEILVAFRARLAPLLDVDRGLDLLAAQTQVGSASPLSYKDYVAAFERDPSVLYPRQPPRPTLLQRLRAAWVSLSDRHYIARLETDRAGDPGKAETLRAAERGDAWAQFALGLAFEHGDGAPRDRTQAYRWFAKAAANAASPDLRSSFSGICRRLEQRMSPEERAAAETKS